MTASYLVSTMLVQVGVQNLVRTSQDMPCRYLAISGTPRNYYYYCCDCIMGTGHTDSCLSWVEAGEAMVVDPNLQEEATAAGLMTVIMNAFGELCAVQKTSGIGLPSSEVCISPHSCGYTPTLSPASSCSTLYKQCLQQNKSVVCSSEK